MASDVSSPNVPAGRVLVVDDDADVQKAAALLLKRQGYEVLAARAPEEAWSILSATAVDVVLLDLNFGPGAVSGAEGLRALQGLMAQDAHAVVVVVTGHSGINIAVAAMRAGAADFVMKPWNNDRLLATLRDAVALRRRRREQPVLEDTSAGVAPVIGEDAALRAACVVAGRAAATDASVLVLGEAGVGKSLLAQGIHRQSRRAAHRLVTVDPGGLWREGPAALEAVLESVDPQGSLVLDEVGGLPAALQRRLEGWLERCPARLIATSRLERGALGLAAGLLDRLSTVEVSLPPLRARGADAVALAEHFLRVFRHVHGRAGLVLSESARGAIAQAPWAGNVRELRHAIERAVVLGQGEALAAEDVRPQVGGVPVAAVASDRTLASTERATVQAALSRHAFNVSRAAKELGLTRAALYRRMARHGL